MVTWSLRNTKTTSAATQGLHGATLESFMKGKEQVIVPMHRAPRSQPVQCLVLGGGGNGRTGDTRSAWIVNTFKAVFDIVN